VPCDYSAFLQLSGGVLAVFWRRAGGVLVAFWQRS